VAKITNSCHLAPHFSKQSSTQTSSFYLNLGAQILNVLIRTFRQRIPDKSKSVVSIVVSRTKRHIDS
jgi:hypothetical protein